MSMTDRPAAALPPKPAPSRWWYLVAAVIFAAGFVAMGFFLFSRIASVGGGLTQIVVPGERTLPLVPGDYTIFHERVSVVDGKVYDSDGIGGLTTTVAGPDGGPLALVPPGMSATYDIGGRSGVAILAFTVSTPGDYRIAAAYPAGETGPQTVIAVGAGFLSALFTTIFGALAFAFGGAGLAVIIGVTVLVKRRRAGFRV